MHQDTKTRRRRRQHPPHYKAELVQLCLSSGASLASIALDHGLNPNLLRRWVIEHERLGLHTDDGVSKQQALAADKPSSFPGFVPLVMNNADTALDTQRIATPEVGSDPDLTLITTARVELTGKRMNATLHWPTSQGPALVTLLRDLMT